MKIVEKKEREKAEEIAKNHLKDELVGKLKSSEEKIDFDKLISDLKFIGTSPMQTILTLIQDFGFELKDAKNRVFDSPVWKGLRDQSEMLTQTFLDNATEYANDVEYYEDGQVNSINFDLTKDNSGKYKQSFWKKLKSKFK